MSKIWRDLDPILMAAVAVDPSMSLEQFLEQAYRQEYAAKAQYRLFVEMSRPRPTTPPSNRTFYPSLTHKPLAEQQPAAITARPTTMASKRIDAAPSPAKETVVRKKPYPCRHCGSDEHTDPLCPRRPTTASKRVLFRPDADLDKLKQARRRNSSQPSTTMRSSHPHKPGVIHQVIAEHITLHEFQDEA